MDDYPDARMKIAAELLESRNCLLALRLKVPIEMAILYL